MRWIPMRITIVILSICALVLLTGCIGFESLVSKCIIAESKLEYYAKRCPQDTILIYGDIEKLKEVGLSSLEDVDGELDIIPGLSILKNKDFQKDSIKRNFGLRKIKEVVIVSPYNNLDSGYFIFAGKFKLNKVKEKLKEYGFSEVDRYDGFSIYKGFSPGFFAISDDKKYIIVHPSGYYSPKYIIKYFSGKRVENSLYTQYKEIIHKLPSNAAWYALIEPAYLIPYINTDIEKIGIAILVDDKKIEYITVYEFEDEKYAKEFVEDELEDYKEDYEDIYEKFDFRREGRYVIVNIVEEL